MFDMMSMMKKVQDLQKNIAGVQEELALIMIEGSAGHGSVKVIVAATGEMKSVQIDDQLLTDKDTLEDLIVIAVEDARAKATALTAERMAPLTAGLPIPPGLKLF